MFEARGFQIAESMNMRISKNVDRLESFLTSIKQDKRYEERELRDAYLDLDKTRLFVLALNWCLWPWM